jgi:hypothetical protein
MIQTANNRIYTKRQVSSRTNCPPAEIHVQWLKYGIAKCVKRKANNVVCRISSLYMQDINNWLPSWWVIEYHCVHVKVSNGYISFVALWNCNLFFTGSCIEKFRLRITAGVTGQQRMLTLPWHLFLSSFLSGVRFALYSTSNICFY